MARPRLPRAQTRAHNSKSRPRHGGGRARNPRNVGGCLSQKEAGDLRCDWAVLPGSAAGARAVDAPDGTGALACVP
eukprot:11143463-Alexandrium_andersonii.AAC.1